ncbi:MAG: rhodanese-like domain-containing protein [Syntrophaceae bacterium]|nr:rhodanese-like domain-containing protein [Syntrophaceae bacterium]
MRFSDILKLAISSLAILIILSFLGLAVNYVSPRGISLVYSPPPEIQINGISVPLIDEKQALNHLNDPGWVFIDTRHKEHYDLAHVSGAIFLSPEEIQDRFIEVQPFINEDSSLILYCYGPDCDMAEKVVAFLSQMGFTKFMIMISGFPAWQSAGYPVESSRR